jgi:hypothetical protein
MSRYTNIGKIKNINESLGILGTPYYKQNFYPIIEEQDSDILILTEFGDRLELLSEQFYFDRNLYWIIAVANPDKVDFGSLFLEPGLQLRIPININNIIRQYNNLNR